MIIRDIKPTDSKKLAVKAAYLSSAVFAATSVFFATAPAVSAKDDIQWLTTEYDFGLIKESEGKRTGTVRGVNRGDTPGMINRVRLSCGCTDETHTEGMIEPGDTATVSFTYNPMGRPGPFRKTVKIYSGSDNRLTTVTMRGTVIGAPETLSTTYPREAGPLRLAQTDIDLGKVRYGTSRHFFLNGYNQSSDTIRPQWHTQSPSIDFGISSPGVPPGEIATFSIYFNSRTEKDMGPTEYNIELTPDKESGEKVILTVRANIEPDTSGLTPQQVDNGPRCVLLPRNVDLGEISGTKPIEFRFTVSNDGKSPMRVMRVSSTSKAVTVKRIPVNVKTGKSGEARGILDPSGLTPGAFRLPVEVYTDDPLHPVTVIDIVGIKK